MATGDGVEDRVKKMEETVLLVHYDLKAIKESLGQVSTALSTLVEVQSKQRVLEERYENRHAEQKAINKVLFTKNDDRAEDIKSINGVFKRIAWTIITVVILGVMTTVGVTTKG